MKLISFVETSTAYHITIWLDETQIDRNGNPSPEWTFQKQWGKMYSTPEGEDIPITPEKALSECRALAEHELNNRISTRDKTEDFAHLIDP